MIFYRGNDDFGPSAAPEWNQQIFDLDTLTERYRGGREKLDSFLNGLVRFQPSAIDPNMFLVNWSVTGGTSVFPEVSLIFNGKKNGILPFGRRSTDTKTQTSTVQSAVGPITVTYRVRTPIFEWVSLTEGAGASNAAPLASSPTAVYTVTGTISFSQGINIVTGVGTRFLSEVRVGDVIVVLLVDPTLPIFGPTNMSYTFKVTSVISDYKLTMDGLAAISGKSYAPTLNPPSTTKISSNIGYHVANLPVTVISIRIGCGITSILGSQADLIGPILVASYFLAIVTPDLSATEVVPNKYWKNRQELITSLIPIPC